MESPNRLHLARFGVYEASFVSGEIWKNGHKIRIQAQPLRVLEILLEKPGELVTREVLQQRLWSKDTFVDFEHSLNAAIKKLRQTLDDSADTPRFIETLPRRGYRFIYPVKWLPMEALRQSRSPSASCGNQDRGLLMEPLSPLWSLTTAGTSFFWN